MLSFNKIKLGKIQTLCQRLAGLLILPVLLSACESGDTDVIDESIRFGDTVALEISGFEQIAPDITNIVMGVGDSVQLQALGHQSDGRVVDVSDEVSWRVSDGSKATVSSDGLLTANAQADMLLVEAFVPIKPQLYVSESFVIRNAVLQSLVIQNEQGASGAGSFAVNNCDAIQLRAVGVFDDGSERIISNHELQWSHNGTKSRIDSSGLVRLGPDTALNITADISAAYTGDVATDFTAAVAALEIIPRELQRISLSPDPANLVVADVQQFQATAHLQDGSQVNVTQTAYWDLAGTALTATANQGEFEATSITDGSPVTVSAACQDGEAGQGTVQVSVASAARVEMADTKNGVYVALLANELIDVVTNEIRFFKVYDVNSQNVSVDATVVLNPVGDEDINLISQDNTAIELNFGAVAGEAHIQFSNDGKDFLFPVVIK